MRHSKVVAVSAVLVVLLMSTQVRCYPPLKYSGCEVVVYRGDPSQCLLKITCDNTIINCGRFISEMEHLNFAVKKEWMKRKATVDEDCLYFVQSVMERFNDIYLFIYLF